MAMSLSDGVAAPKRPAPPQAPRPSLQQVVGGFYNTPTTPPPSIARPIQTQSSSTYQPRTPASYIAPIPNYTPQASPPAGAFNGGFGGGGGGMPSGGGFDAGGGAGGPSTPSVPAGPIAGGREWYSRLGPDAKAAQDAQYLAGDSDYTEQIGQYDKALQDFIDRITGRKKEYDEDANLANASTNQNKTLTLDSLGEDFGARGLSYSGMFDTEKNRTSQRFTDALKNIAQVQTRNKSAADNDLADYRSENQIGRGNARRAALQRMIQNQSLIDTGAMF